MGETALAVILSMLCFHTAFSQNDTTAFLKVSHLAIASNSYTLQTTSPKFDQLNREFSRKSTLGFRELTDIESKNNFSSIYSGFKIAFQFQGSLLQKIKVADALFLAFETGSNRTNLFSLLIDDSTAVSYRLEAEVFRLSFGFRKILTKSQRRIRFFTGLDWIHEFQISNFLFEEERRLFARKQYSLYLAAPIGLEYRFSGKKSAYKRYRAAFFSLQFGAGIQNTDPYRLLGSYNGSSLGFIFSI
ncbi:MAG: hypothetical protein AAF789_03190 [Bacteroidota bacterium]